METLNRGRAMARDFQDEREWAKAAGYLLGTVEHALIVLEIQRENCSFEEGYTSPEVQSLADQAALLPITHSVDYSFENEKELPAEVEKQPAHV